MKIIGYIASPRKKGNTAWTVERILEGAQKQGARTRAWHSSELFVNTCRGCLSCVRGEGCVVNDDMQGIYRELKSADALVLGAPIYMGQMSAQAKTFTDRLFAQITPRFSPRYKEENSGKKLVLAFTQGNPDPGMFQEYYDYTKKMFQLLEFDVVDVIVVSGTRSVDASENEDLSASLLEAGSSLVN
jgi:multimeric flavodoxin WrbA